MERTRTRLAGLTATAAVAFVSCSGPLSERDAGPEPLFPEELSGWTEGRSCAFTHEHELRYIRVLCDEDADAPYRELSADYPYPVGATLVKLEYGDPGCTELLGYTAMQKEVVGFSALGNDWRWQRLSADRDVIEDGEIETCITCHQHHCTWPECGYEGCGIDLTCGKEN